MIGSKLSLTSRVLIALSVLTGLMLLALGGLAVWGGVQHGRPGVVAAAVACSICWGGGVVALAVPLIFRDPQSAIQGVLLGMFFRMGTPMLAAVVLFQSQSELLRVGVMEMLVGVYLAGLLVETLLSWWIAETSAGAHAPGMAKAS